jgi:peptidoglycan/xylan/chitin deacetylase (PgdA/CDA1 family)
MLHLLFTWTSHRARILVGWVAFNSGLYRRMLRGKAVIVVFHRVNDAYPNDPITSSTKEFDDYVRFFSRFFEVVPLSGLLAMVAAGDDLGARLAITFDDGYLGNATVAAPILKRHAAKAAFFVTTGFIGTNRVPPWDKRSNIATEWMNWDHIRALRDAGHEIGSHTANHVDLGVTNGQAARDEIRMGKQRVEAELSEPAPLFAYPFGGKKQMSEDNLTQVKELGLRCCVSAYGGTVSAGDDPFRLKRTTISRWFASPYHFGFELITGRLEQK